MYLVFLSSRLALTKTFAVTNGELAATPYPHVSKVTSHHVAIDGLDAFHAALVEHAKAGHCLFGGQLKRPLHGESRAGLTATDAKSWVVFDFDKVEAKDAADVVKRYLPAECQQVSYIAQLSASMFRPDCDSWSGHIFMLLDTPIDEQRIKQWFEHLNFTVPGLTEQLKLSDSEQALHWPLDRTVAYNSKLIFIAPPKCYGFKPAVSESITLVKKRKATLTIPAFTPVDSATIRTKINELRRAIGLDDIAYDLTPFEGEWVLNETGEVNIHGIKTSGDHFIRFNLNGGDSYAYFIDLRRPDLIRNFKGEPFLKTEEAAPDLWKSLRKVAPRAVTKAALNDGTEILAFYATNQSSTVKIGSYDPVDRKLVLNNSSERAARAWLSEYGIVKQGDLPHMDLTFDPGCDVQYIAGSTQINTFRATEYMAREKTAGAKASSIRDVPPMADKIIKSMLGNPTDEIYTHFLNWLAYIFQFRKKTTTAWVLTGTEGCLSASTELEVSHGSHRGRKYTVEQLFHKLNDTGKAGKRWNLNLPTKLKSKKDDWTVGYHEVMKVVDSGVKTTFTITTETGRSLRVTKDHPFLRPNGKFTKLKKLKVGDRVAVEGPQSNSGNGSGRNKQRKTIHSIPFHPTAWRHVIAGKDYKRNHRARLIVEANMNGMSLEAFVEILRTDAERAATLQYLEHDVIVHHIDENPDNDALENLAVVDKLNHDAHHAKETGLGFLSVAFETVTSIEKHGEEQTYDIVMKAPYHNYSAHGFITHNTGKGSFVKYYLRPVFGNDAVKSVQFGLLNQEYNDFLEQALFVVFEEADIDSVENQASLQAKLRHYVTDDPITIRRMRTDPYEARSYCNLMFFSNKGKPVLVPSSDRRFNIAERQNQRMFLSPNEIKLLSAGAELDKFADVLLNWPVNELQVTQLVETQTRQDMHEATTTVNQLIADAVTAGDLQFFIDRMPSDVEASSDFNNRFNPIGMYRALLDRYIHCAESAEPVLVKDEDLFVLFRTLIPDARYFQDSKTWRKRHYKSLGLDVEHQHRVPGDPKKRDRGILVQWAAPSETPARPSRNASDVVTPLRKTKRSAK